MSGKAIETGALSGAQLIEDQAADWFSRKTFWNWTESDEAALQAWLAQSAAHELALWRLEAEWVRGERMSALKHVAAKAPESGARRGFARSFGRAIMGVAIIGVLALGIFAYLSRPQEITYATGLGEHRTIALSDGSKIELNTDSVLRIAVDAKHRLAYLDRGEAFFEIKHDASRPFVVTAAGHRVTDLGTAFLMLLDNDHLTVLLTQGRARLEAKGPQSTRAVLLSPGDTAVATQSSLSLHKSSGESVAQFLGWRRGLLLFDHATVAQAAAEFNRYNTRKLVIADAVAGRRTVTGTFQTNNIDDFTSLARDVLGLHIQRLGQETVISR